MSFKRIFNNAFSISNEVVCDCSLMGTHGVDWMVCMSVMFHASCFSSDVFTTDIVDCSLIGTHNIGALDCVVE